MRPCPADARHRRPVRQASRAFAVLAVIAALCSPGLGGQEPADAQRALTLRAGTFDPLREPGPVPAWERPDVAPLDAGRRRAFVVQWHAVVDADARRSVGRLGARVEAALGPDALLIVAPTGVARLDALPGVRAVRDLQPGWSVSPALVRRLHDAADESRGRVLVDVLLFRGDDAAAVAARVVRRFPGTRVEHVRAGRRGAAPRVTLDVATRRLAEVVTALEGAHVHALELAPRHTLYNDQVAWIVQSYDALNGPSEAAAADPKPYPLSGTIWNRGLRGENQVIAVADTGLETGLCAFEDPARTVLTSQVTPPAPLVTDPLHRKVLVVNAVSPGLLAEDGTFRHGSHVAGTALGDDHANPAGPGGAGHDTGDGVAPAARLLFEDVGPGRDANCVGTIVVPSIGDLLVQEAVSGAHVSSNSWGGDESTEFSGAYTARTREVDEAAWAHEDFTILFAAGNSGAGGFNDYAACKSCLAVGASENHEPARGLDPEDMATFSSHGPAADGRLKPDVVAPGDRVFSPRLRTLFVEDETSSTCTAPAANEEVCFRAPFLGGCYVAFTDETCAAHALRGTSMATPAAAALAALARQYFVDGFYPSGAASALDGFVPSSALLRAILVAAGRNMTGALGAAPLADAPSNVQGWGRLALDDALAFTGETRGLIVHDVPTADGPGTGASRRFTFEVTDPAEPLRVVLAWTDPPGSPMAAAALVNDLDLEVAAPGGTLYAGNRFTADDPLLPGDKQSVPDPPDRDALNTIEGVLLDAPVAGAWTVTVRGTAVPGFAGTTTQGFALVVVGAVGPGGAGRVPGQPGAPGAPVTVSDAGGGDVTIDWTHSCIESDADYALYEGALGDFGSHGPVLCSTGGATSATVTPAAGSRYFLVAPHDGVHDGSVGEASDGTPRSAGPAPCRPRLVADCD